MRTGRIARAVTVRRAVAPALALALLAAAASGARADTQSKLNDAKAQLASLEKKISGQETRLQGIQGQLGVLQTRVAAARAKAEQTAIKLTATQALLADAQNQYNGLREQLDALARSAYMEGPGGGLEVILGANSMSDLNDRVQFVQQISQVDASVAHQVAGVAAQLGQEQAGLDDLLRQRSSQLAQLSGQQRKLDGTLAAQQQAVDELNATRSKIVKLVSTLQAKLQAEAIASLGNTFQGGAHTTYGNWAQLFLQTMGVSGCHNNMVVVVAWQVAEFTQAGWNPLATTTDMPGATIYNSAGVKNYVSLQQGLDATRITIVNGSPSYKYGPIVSSLAGCADPMATARAINASSWCRGCAGGHYVTGNVPEVEANYDTYAKL